MSMSKENLSWVAYNSGHTFCLRIIYKRKNMGNVAHIFHDKVIYYQKIALTVVTFSVTILYD